MESTSVRHQSRWQERWGHDPSNKEKKRKENSGNLKDTVRRQNYRDLSNVTKRDGR